jgi:hypothetical protein
MLRRPHDVISSSDRDDGELTDPAKLLEPGGHTYREARKILGAHAARLYGLA